MLNTGEYDFKYFLEYVYLALLLPLYITNLIFGTVDFICIIKKFFLLLLVVFKQGQMFCNIHENSRIPFQIVDCQLTTKRYFHKCNI